MSIMPPNCLALRMVKTSNFFFKMYRFQKFRAFHAQNLIEKIAQKYAVNATSAVYQGDFISIQPHRVMTHDNTAVVMKK
jgi:hypothetical protein